MVNLWQILEIYKMRNTKFKSAFTCDDIEKKLVDLDSFAAYSFNKRNNPEKFNMLISFLPEGYKNKLFENIESIDLVYSGSIESPYLLTLAVGRNDRFDNKECFDIDVFNIAPDTESADTYFRQQWHHFKDENGRRASYNIHPYIILEELKRKDITYNTFLTGSTTYSSLQHYQEEKPSYFELHNKSFGSLNQK
jgi:hypothetical protein